MENNDILLLSEVIYHINAAQTMADLERDLFYYIGLLIPLRYASYIEVREDTPSGKQSYTIRFCRPAQFAKAEKTWLDQLDKADTIWLSSSTESVVIRGSELFHGNRRLDTPSYQTAYQRFHVFDDMQMNVVSGGKTVGRISLYRTQEEGSFSEQDAFLLRLLSKHINLAVDRCLNRGRTPDAEPDLPALAQVYDLTRREEEVLGCIFQGMDNAAICDALKISKNTLYKHNNSIFQKCGVRSRWDLLKLRQ